MQGGKKLKRCPYCGFYPPAIYTYRLDDFCVSTLLKIWQHIIEQGTNQFRFKDLNLNHTENSRRTQLRFHALIAKVKNEKGRQIPDTWLLTERGTNFLHGRKVVPKYVLTQANKVIGHAKEYVSRQDFKVMRDFRTTFEIKNSKVIQIEQTQNQLFNTNFLYRS